MNHLIVRSFIVGVLLAFLTGCQNQDKIEDEIWACISTQFAAKNYDLEDEFSEYETFLVEEGYLPEATSAGYLSIFLGMEETNDVRPLPIKQDFFEIMNQVMSDNSEPCTPEKDITKTKLYQIKLKAEEIINNANDLNISLVGKVMQDVYTEQDLEHPFHRFTILMNMTQFVERDTGIARQLPSLDEFEKPAIEERNNVMIELDENNETTFNQNPLVLESLKEQLLPYIRGSKNDKSLPALEQLEIAPHGLVEVSKAVIRLHSDRAASYANYIAVQNEIVAAFNQVRDETSQKYYQKKYEALSEEEQTIVQQMVPFRFSETE